MAGHSHWAGIKHKKGKADKQRSKIFSKLSKEITVAAKLGSKDADTNPRLRSAIQAARAANMPKDNIDRVLKKATGGGEETNYEEIRYEGYGPGGVAIIIDALTDNRNRTASEVRAAFSKYGGNLGETNSVGFMFDRIGLISYPKDLVSSEAAFEAAVESGASDVEATQSSYEFICSPEEFNNVREYLEDEYGQPESAGLSWKPQSTVELSADQASTLLKLLDVLDDNDDVQSTAANFEISDEVLEKLTN